jgi:hypothetical protein
VGNNDLWVLRHLTDLVHLQETGALAHGQQPSMAATARYQCSTAAEKTGMLCYLQNACMLPLQAHTLLIQAHMLIPPEHMLLLQATTTAKHKDTHLPRVHNCLRLLDVRAA